MGKNLLVFIIAIILLATGASVYYFYGYKDSFWIDAMSYVPVIFGWLILAALLVFAYLKFRARLLTRKVALRKISDVLFLVLCLVWLAGLIAAFVGLDYAMEHRIETVLTSGDVHLTSATVVEVENRRLKSTTHRYAIIEYTAKGTMVRQAIKDDAGLYQTGQQIPVKYSDRYTDMFAIVSAY